MSSLRKKNTVTCFTIHFLVDIDWWINKNIMLAMLIIIIILILLTILHDNALKMLIKHLERNPACKKFSWFF